MNRLEEIARKSNSRVEEVVADALAYHIEMHSLTERSVL